MHTKLANTKPCSRDTLIYLHFQNIILRVLKNGSYEDREENARLQYFVGIIAFDNLVKSTLGTKSSLINFGIWIIDV